jgi:DNA replicative helicase MCM subunit Mcm2 (Cdc46/Mcm family)
VPRSITVVLEDDLVDSAALGEDILVSGLVIFQWPKRMDTGMRADLDAVVKANHLERPKARTLGTTATQGASGARHARRRGALCGRGRRL